MKYKGILIAAASAAAAIVLLVLTLNGALFRGTPVQQAPKFRTEEQTILHSREDHWEPFSMVGVNIGTGYPGLFPNESGIEERTYERWFNLIGDMNVNTVRVYQIQSPDFYSALLRYNETHETPIYLLHSVDFPEDLIYSEENLLDPQGYEPVFRNTRDMVDALHGDLLRYDSRDDRLDLYTDDVSAYVAGYILGIEWDPFYVEYLCRLNPQLVSYEGDYLRSSDGANPFEIFLSMWGDMLLRYEDERYGTQPLISFANWPDTDPMINELNTDLIGRWQQKTEITLDVEHILATDRLRSGIFASYNVYPYFPVFLQYGDYTTRLDDSGSPKPYRAYVADLVTHHSCPVVITEFGVPSSRSRAYTDLWQGFSHGGLTERQQGEAFAAMFADIRNAGCAGAFAFSWQDEWYKTVWNERLISDPERRAFWSNAQSAEQFFGLLAFEPGTEGETCYPDGSLGDWEGIEPIFEENGTSVSMQQDAKYVYFLVQGLDSRPKMHSVSLALDLIPEAGADQVGPVSLERNADFIIRIDGSQGGSLYVDRESDLLSFSMLGRGQNLSIQSMSHVENAVARERIPMPEDDHFLLVLRGENNVFANLASTSLVNPVGRLVHGNTNPGSDCFEPNADYFCTEDAAEIRIPWQLLNFRDPSDGQIVQTSYQNGLHIQSRKISTVYAGAFFDDQTTPVSFGSFRLENWEQPVFHERLKESYYILRDAFGTVNSD